MSRQRTAYEHDPYEGAGGAIECVCGWPTAETPRDEPYIQHVFADAAEELAAFSSPSGWVEQQDIVFWLTGSDDAR